VKVKQVAILGIIAVSVMKSSLRIWAEEVIHRTEEEVVNIVSQKLSIAKSEKDVAALQAAKGMMFGISKRKGISIYHHHSRETAFKLQLQILQVADSMQDKSYDHTVMPKAGWYGSVPWPPENERPEALRNARPWYPRTPPEYYKESNPELYAFYKPLYEENLRNTKKHQYEGGVRGVREGLLRDIRRELKHAYDSSDRSSDFSLYLRLVDEIIENKPLRDEILADIPREPRPPAPSASTIRARAQEQMKREQEFMRRTGMSSATVKRIRELSATNSVENRAQLMEWFWALPQAVPASHPMLPEKTAVTRALAAMMPPSDFKPFGLKILDAEINALRKATKWEQENDCPKDLILVIFDGLIRHTPDSDVINAFSVYAQDQAVASDVRARFKAFLIERQLLRDDSQDFDEQ
jgi:hypothetical protein